MSAPEATSPAVVALSARQLARRRRAETLRRGWAEFRQHRAGLVGLVILVVFVLLALTAPLLASSSDLSVTQATGRGARAAVVDLLARHRRQRPVRCSRC